MKILRAFLLIFTISLTFNAAYAQRIGPVDLCEGFKMTVTSLRSPSEGVSCFEVKLENDSPEYLFIKVGECIIESPNETVLYETDICIGNGECNPLLELLEGSTYVYISCGTMRGFNDLIYCYDGCDVMIDSQ